MYTHDEIVEKIQTSFLYEEGSVAPFVLSLNFNYENFLGEPKAVNARYGCATAEVRDERMAFMVTSYAGYLLDTLFDPDAPSAIKIKTKRFLGITAVLSKIGYKVESTNTRSYLQFGPLMFASYSDSAFPFAIEWDSSPGFSFAYGVAGGDKPATYGVTLTSIAPGGNLGEAIPM